MSFKKIKGISARRTATLCLTAVMTASFVAGNVFAFAQNGGKKTGTSSVETSSQVSFEDVTGKIDLSAIKTQNLSTSVLENAGFKTKSLGTQTVIVTLDTDCVIDSMPDGVSASEYLDGYDGGRTLKKIKQSQTNFLNNLSAMGIDYKVQYTYSTVTNAVAVSVDTAYISEIKSIPSVEAAFVSERYAYPEAIASDNGVTDISKVYATGIYDSSEYVDKGIDGSGMTVAILDTGLDYTHEAFTKYMPSTLGLDKAQLEAKLDNKDFKAVELSAANGKTIDADDLWVSEKVPFAYDYADKDADVYPSYSQHGTHVAGIVAGHADSYKDKDGNVVNSPFFGSAPNAQLVICKVFTDDFESKELGGATSENIIAALEDCVNLGVDVINMSLGTTSGFSSDCLGSDDEGKQLAAIYKRIKTEGISLICAASNDYSAGFGSDFGTNLATNPDSGTVGSPSTFEGALSVASINGQLSPFIKANGKDAIFFNESSNANGERYDFIKQLLKGEKSKTFKYVNVGGFGQAQDYTTDVLKELADKSQGPTIAVVKRGSTNFQEKVQLAQIMGADAVIVDNNVSGMVRMSLGDLVDPIPAIFVSQEAGQKLRKNENNKNIKTGVIELNSEYYAGPYMNDYSSWGSTPDLKLKPDITAHGGEITSTVAGGYAEMSGTSMATPNLAGFVALVRSQLKLQHPDWNNVQLNQRINQLVMSTAQVVYDESGLPYSPRKQGAGLATLDNVFGTKAYLYTLEGVDFGAAEDNRPKIELGEDEAKNGVYKLKFYVQNFGTETLKFKTKSIFMTESLSQDKNSVAEKAYLMDGSPVWKINGSPLSSDGIITLGAGENAAVECTLNLSEEDKRYLNTSFINGMFVEGFLQLESLTENQCALTLPFMGFYGDWEAAPMLDFDAYYLAEAEQDTSILENAKPKARVWATQAYASYTNNKYSIPLGSYCFTQDPNAQQIYTDMEHCSVSRFNVNGEDEDSNSNYMTADSINALYAGLLRNAELVTYDVIDSATGEVILSNNVYRVNKAYSGGGSARPAQVLMELSPEELGLKSNGKYEINYHFFFKESDAEDESKINDDNTFSMSFYVDYEAPILVDSRIRYRDYTDSNNKQKQSVYLDLDVFDNHYAQAVILCYSEREDVSSAAELHLVTDYITPIYNANKNGTTTVSIEITDIFDKYKGNLYVEIDDYALNHCVYAININRSNSGNLPDSFELDGPDEVTIGVNEAYKIKLAFDNGSDANASNFTWSLDSYDVIDIKNGEIFGKRTGDAVVTVVGNGTIKRVKVHVIDKGLTLPTPTLSFGVIENSRYSQQKASGTVSVHAGKTFTLEVLADNWYYPLSKIGTYWTSDNPDIAEVTQSGVVTTKNKRGSATIIAVPVINGQTMSRDYAAIVKLNVQDPFSISNNELTRYHGSEEHVVIPADKTIMTIGEEAFKDNTTMKTLVIPKTVTEISEKAFINCTALEEVYFVSEEALPVPDSGLTNIRKRAFAGCTSLRVVDLTNVKKITLDNRVFLGCTSLEEVIKMDAIGTMYYSAFEGCKSLKSADLTGLHVSGHSVFKDCTSLNEVKTAYYTAIGENMFSGCTSLKDITISTPNVSANAFADSGLTSVVFEKAAGETRNIEFNIGAQAFMNCVSLTNVDFKNHTVQYLGDRAFAGCSNLAAVNNLSTVVNKGIRIYEGTKMSSVDDVDSYGAIYSGTTLVDASDVTSSNYTLRSGTTAIASSAFSGSKVTALTVPSSVTSIGAGAFMNSALTEVTFLGDISYIPEYAFYGSRLTSVTVPSTVTEIGAYAFANCAQLRTLNFAGGRTQALNIGVAAFANCSVLEAVSLPEISGSTLARYAFANCKALTSVNLNNVTTVGIFAFENCANLETVNLESLENIGAYAFAGCVSIANLNLASAKVIGVGAFRLPEKSAKGYSSVTFPVAEEIGAEAFSGGKESGVVIPASLKKLGEGAFAYSDNLSGITVDEGNKDYFVYSNVLYRIISGNKDSGEYELCCYPSDYISSVTDGASTLQILEGTVAVQGGAFKGVKANSLKRVVFPYSVKAIGSGAFYASGVTEYHFNCINAPTLYADWFDNGMSAFNSLYYTNFVDEMLHHADNIISVPPSIQVAKLTIVYPENGIGYENYIYSNYFSTKNIIAEIMDDTTRLVKNLIEGFMSADKVKEMNSLPVTDENRAVVEAFSDSVKYAHGIFNTITGEKQLGFLGEDNIKKLTDIEAELKSVKARFGIKVTVDRISVDASSNYKCEYKTGDKFNIKGLVLLVTYDDYSTELISDTSKMTVTVVGSSSGELTELNRYVTVGYGGKTVQVDIHVSEGGAASGGSINPAVIYGPIIGVVAAAGIAVGIVFLVKKLKKGAKPSEESENVEPVSDADDENLPKE